MYLFAECQGLNANSAMNRGEYANQVNLEVSLIDILMKVVRRRLILVA